MRKPSPLTLGVILLLAGVIGWAYLPTLRFLLTKWYDEPQYSHGFLVPLFAIYVAYTRREAFPATPGRGTLLGYAALPVAFAVRYAGHLADSPWLDGFSLILCVAALVLVFGGVGLFRRAWPGIVFLLFMLPLPYRLEVMLGYRLQGVATAASTFALQTLGQPAVAEGHTILLNEFKLGIVEACSGLRMLVTFFAFATAVCMVTKRTILGRVLLILSAVPIALTANMCRIVATGLLFAYTSNDTARVFFHDLAGWFMMPLGLALLVLELWVARRLVVEVAAAPRPTFAARPAMLRAQ